MKCTRVLRRVTSGVFTYSSTNSRARLSAYRLALPRQPLPIRVRYAPSAAVGWTGTFRDYLGMVLKQPSLAQRAHARLYTIEFISIKVAETRRGSRWSNPGILSGETAHR